MIAETSEELELRLANEDLMRRRAAIEQQKTTEIPFSESIEQRMARIEEKARQLQSVEDYEAGEVIAALVKQGYPQRHINRVRSMSGPSLEKAQQLLPRIQEDCLIVLIGDRGPGKTQMATLWAYERKKAGKSAGYYRKTADFIGEIKATWSEKGKKTEEDVLKKYRACGFLVLDEWGEKGASEWESRVLVNIIDHRYDNELATVIIGNMTEAQAKEQIHSSILSRAEETGGLVVCDWPSYRASV